MASSYNCCNIMRQKIQSYEDAKLRKALENMRYKACTSEDIVFLHS
jgi:hypothetical protein